MSAKYFDKLSALIGVGSGGGASAEDLGLASRLDAGAFLGGRSTLEVEVEVD